MDFIDHSVAPLNVLFNQFSKRILFDQFRAINKVFSKPAQVNLLSQNHLRILMFSLPERDFKKIKCVAWKLLDKLWYHY